MDKQTLADENEMWKPIDGYEFHEVSSAGRIRSVDHIEPGGRYPGRQRRKGRVLKPYKAGRGAGHLAVRLGLREPTVYVHRLVLEAFVGPCPVGMEACHNDGNRKNNRVDNLRWDTRKENAADSVRHGTSPAGSKHHMSRLSEEKIPAIRERLERGESQASVAADYGLAQTTISRIARRVGWRHVA